MSELIQTLSSLEPHAKILLELESQGCSVVDNFLANDIIQALRNDLLTQWQEGKFNPAGIGKGSQRIINQTIRSDNVCWLEPQSTTPAQTIYWHSIEQLRLSLNRQLFLGLVEFEAHQSVYPAGSFYCRHLDQFYGVGLREVTVILYLNDNWQPHEGGELLLYTDMTTQKPLKTIYPRAGQLVVFMSADFPHEVLPANRQRLSITGWFKKRDIN